MTLAAYPVAAVRAAEAAVAAGLPPGTLMQRAAHGLAACCARDLGTVYGRRVLVLAGRGDNGADALWAGALLAGRGARVEAVLGGSSGPSLEALLRAGGRVVAAPGPSELLLDGLVGTGGRGGLRPEAARLVAAATPQARRVVAVDVPSGVDADTGVVDGAAVRADVTVTFGCLKPGLLVGEGQVRAGRVELVDIGLGQALGHLVPGVEVLEARDVLRLLPSPGPESDKYVRGVLGVVAGSPAYTGAAVLCVGSALRAGAGMVRYRGARAAADAVRARWPEAVVTEAEGAGVVQHGRVQAWVVGPGLGTDHSAEAALEAVLAQPVPVLVDADALTLLARHPGWAQQRRHPTVLTPHDRELARFGREVGPDRLGAARALAQELGAVVVLKGAATVVADAHRRTRVSATGSPALATAGTGDVLSGAGGALLAQGLEAFDAAAVAAWVHGRAGVLAAAGTTTTAADVLEAWPLAVRSLGGGP